MSYEGPHPFPVRSGGSGANTLTGVLSGNGTTPFTASPITQFNILVAGASNAISSIAPSATTGIALVSQGAASNPAFGTVVVAGGGTGATTLTNHSVLIGAGTSAITQVGPVASTGCLLASNGVGSDPGFTTATYPLTTTSQQILYSTAANVVGQLTTANSAIAATNSSGTLAMRAFSVVTQVFTSNGTYTPTSGMLYCIAEVLGGGGGGGGAAGGANAVAAAGGGGSGGYAKKTISAATIGASQSITVGTAGSGGAAGNNNGSAGGTSSVGAIVSATGGGGGTGGASVTGAGNNSINAAGAGGVGSSGDVNANGSYGNASFGNFIAGTNAWAFGGFGGNSIYGGAGPTTGISSGSHVAGTAATVYGAGGAGGASCNDATGAAGGNGSAGIIVITEYVIA